MHEMLSFMVSVAAGVTSNLISKWLDRMLNKDLSIRRQRQMCIRDRNKDCKH